MTYVPSCVNSQQRSPRYVLSKYTPRVAGHKIFPVDEHDKSPPVGNIGTPAYRPEKAAEQNEFTNYQMPTCCAVAKNFARQDAAGRVR